MTLTFTPWHFLTAPMADLLEQCRVLMVLDDDGADGFLAGVHSAPTGELTVRAAVLDGGIERDTVIRGVLAAWYGIDTTDWPVAMELRGEATQ